MTQAEFVIALSKKEFELESILDESANKANPTIRVKVKRISNSTEGVGLKKKYDKNKSMDENLSAIFEHIIEFIKEHR